MGKFIENQRSKRDLKQKIIPPHLSKNSQNYFIAVMRLLSQMHPTTTTDRNLANLHYKSTLWKLPSNIHTYYELGHVS